MTFMEEKESVTVNLCVPGYTRGGLLVVSDSASLVTHNEQSATRVARYTHLPVTDSLYLRHTRMHQLIYLSWLDFA